MYKYLLISLVLLFGCQYQSSAQEIINSENRQHIIHLKNGSSIIGVLLAYRDGIPAVIRVGDGEEISVPRESIHSLEPVTQRKAKSKIRKSKDGPYLFKETGWHYGGNLGYISKGAFINTEGLLISIDVNSTYYFSRMLGVGMSVGYDSYGAGGFQDLVPVQIILSGYLSPKNTSLFYSVGAGYAIAISDKEESDWSTVSNKGGLALYPKIGIRLNGKDGMNTTLFSGIKIQKSTLETRWGEEQEESTTQDRTFKRLIIGIGIVF